MSLAHRLGVPDEYVERLELLASPSLPDPDKLITKAFELGPKDPEGAQVLLAASVLSQAQRTPEGRPGAALALLAPLITQADPYKTLGPQGAGLRAEIMPNGWKWTLGSWNRLRYAWREGMRELLDVADDDPAANALDEITRLSPSEPEPVSVAIQENWPPGKIAFSITLLGLGLSVYNMYRNMEEAEEIRTELKRRKRNRVKKKIAKES